MSTCFVGGGGNGGGTGNRFRSDWRCPDCFNVVFGSKRECGKCGKWRPKEISGPLKAPEFRPGDWTCSCSEINFGSRVVCRKCGAQRQGIERGIDGVVSSSSSSSSASTFTPAPSKEECCICLDAKTESVFSPCGHRCCCIRCAEELSPKVCPKCRAPVASVVKRVFE